MKKLKMDFLADFKRYERVKFGLNSKHALRSVYIYDLNGLLLTSWMSREGRKEISIRNPKDNFLCRVNSYNKFLVFFEVQRYFYLFRLCLEISF